jgi:predicted kinase
MAVHLALPMRHAACPCRCLHRRAAPASEADAAVLHRQQTSVEPLDRDERAQAIGVDTGRSVPVAALQRAWQIG